jgi:Fe2+ transport system protein FeoA
MTFRLSDLPPGESGTVMAVQSASASRLHRLSLLGVLPGSTITVIQRWPSYVMRVGFTELSLDGEIADDILLAPAGF